MTCPEKYERRIGKAAVTDMLLPLSKQRNGKKIFGKP
jgi:hypothetical protein